MKKIIYYLLFILAIACEVNAAAMTAAVAGHSTDPLADKALFMRWVSGHLEGRSLEEFKPEVIGPIDARDLLLMSGCALASHIADYIKNRQEAEARVFTKGRDIVSDFATREDIPPFLCGCTITDIIRPTPFIPGTTSPFPTVVGLILDTHIAAIGKICCFGHSSFASIKDLVIAYAALYKGGEIDGMISNACRRLLHQWIRYGLPPERFAEALNISQTGNILEEDPTVLEFMAKDWQERWIKLMSHFICTNEPNNVCGPFGIQELVRALQLMGGEAEKMAAKATRAASYNILGASNRLLERITQLNGLDNRSLSAVRLWEQINKATAEDSCVVIDLSPLRALTGGSDLVTNWAPVGEEANNFTAFGRKETIFQTGQQWGKAMELPSVSVVPSARLEVATKARGGAGAGAMTDSFGPFQSAPPMTEAVAGAGGGIERGDAALDALGSVYAALTPAGTPVDVLLSMMEGDYAAKKVLAGSSVRGVRRGHDVEAFDSTVGAGDVTGDVTGGDADKKLGGTEQVYEGRDFAMVASIYAGDMPLMAGGVRFEHKGEAAIGDGVANGGAGAAPTASGEDKAPNSTQASVLSWLSSSRLGGIIMGALRAGGIDVSPILPTPKVMPRTVTEREIRSFQASVLATHSPEGILADLAIAYAVQKWPDIIEEYARALRLESALKAVTEGAEEDA